MRPAAAGAGGSLVESPAQNVPAVVPATGICPNAAASLAELPLARPVIFCAFTASAAVNPAADVRSTDSGTLDATRASDSFATPPATLDPSPAVKSADVLGHDSPVMAVFVTAVTRP